MPKPHETDTLPLVWTNPDPVPIGTGLKGEVTFAPPVVELEPAPEELPALRERLRLLASDLATMRDRALIAEARVAELEQRQPNLQPGPTT
jgi:hypothetical protein